MVAFFLHKWNRTYGSEIDFFHIIYFGDLSKSLHVDPQFILFNCYIEFHNTDVP